METTRGKPSVHQLIKTDQRPEVNLLKKGRYDEAIKAALGSIQDDKKDYYQYQGVASIYYYRAIKEPSSREKWIEQSVFYIDKSVSLAPDDPLNSAQAAAALIRIGDSSDKACPYYEKARHYAQDSMSQLKGDSIFLGDEKMPNQPIRDKIAKLQNSLNGKIEATCSSTPQP